MPPRAGAWVLLGILPTLLGGCGGGDEKQLLNTSSRNNSLSSMFRTTVSVGTSPAPANAQYECWIATRPSQRDEGFSFISPSDLPPGRGMIVVYPSNRNLSFVGRDTLVGLDVVYAEAVAEGIGRITDIGIINPFSRTPFGSSKPAKYALFVQGSDLSRSGAKVGDLLYVPVTTPSN